MPLFEDVQAHNDDLVRKALGVGVWVAPYSAAPITSILDSADGTFLAPGADYVQLGRPSEEGISFARETEVSEIFGHGSVDPARSDIRRAIKRASVTLLEVRKKVLELAQGVSSLGETVSKIPATTGNQQVKWDEPSAPTYPYMRLLVVAADITNTGEIYIARHALRCKVTEVGEEVWSDQDQAMTTPLTFTFYNDSTAGTPLRHFRGGPGYKEIIADEGFTAAS